MFKRSFRSHDQQRVDKTARLKKPSSTRDQQKVSKLQRSLTGDEFGVRGGHQHHGHYHHQHGGAVAAAAASGKNLAPSPIVTLMVGREGRLFAAHEDVLCQSPFFEAACRGQYTDAQQGGKRISLPDEEPEVFSAVLEYLYKGDYYPRLIHNKHGNSWELEDSVMTDIPNHHHTPRRTPYPSPNPTEDPSRTPGGYSTTSAGTTAVGGGRNHHLAASPNTQQVPCSVEPTVYLSSLGESFLRDTVVYCAADRYGLDELKRLALRKQGLQSGIDVATILRSAQYAYAHTPDSDSRLRAHYLALIIRCRKTFKRSGTMQAAMEEGGSKLFFDLFVAMCNHLDDVIDVSNSRTPRTV